MRRRARGLRGRTTLIACAVLGAGSVLLALNIERSASASPLGAPNAEPRPFPVTDETRPPSPKRADLVGLASWYSRHDPGIRSRTANNERFDDTKLTAAMWGVPFHKKVRVTNLENGRSVVVRINDRGPHPRYVRRGRVIDMTKAAFSRIADPKKGLVRVALDFL